MIKAIKTIVACMIYGLTVVVIFGLVYSFILYFIKHISLSYYPR